MSKVLQFFREDIDPRFKDVSDRELTNFIKNEYPDFLQDEDFKSWVSDMESAPPPLPDEMEGSEPSFLQNAIDYFKEDMQRPVGMEPPTDPITFNVASP